jgi:hypothetical protein
MLRFIKSALILRGEMPLKQLRYCKYGLLGSVAVITTILTIQSAYAVRPFITDDARVVGKDLAQIESWVRVGEINLQHWILPAYGPSDWLEVSAGGLHGYFFNEIDGTQYSIAGPLIQAKALLFPPESNSTPGVAFSLGSILPYGTGGFRISKMSPYGYLALTQNINKEYILVHANLGAVSSNDKTVLTWGLATQFEIFGGFHGIAEIISGDPYNEEARGGASQVGFRHILSEWVQLDGTFGAGIWGDPRLPWWVAGGVRWVFKP